MPSEVLDFVTIEGFKSIRSIEKLALEPINVMVGANGSGKSNFISAFSFLHAIREGRLQDYVRRAGGAEQLLHFGSKVSSEIHVHVSFGEGVNQYELRLRPTEDDSLFVGQEIVYFWRKQHKRPYHEGLAPRSAGREAGISDPSVTGTASWVRLRLGLFRLYHVHDTSSSSPMRKTSQINDNEFLRPDGSNLAAFLYLLQQKHSPEYELIRRTIERVTPSSTIFF